MRDRAKFCAFLAALAVLAGGTADAAPRKKPQRVTQQPLIVCGQTGCFDVPPGCGHEMRSVGWDLTAVVICDRK